MDYILSLLKSHRLFLLVLIIAIFFRTYDVVTRFDFAHDGDLFSWIVKDIVVDHHFRLIGQQTTAPGIFIGPLFYYMLIPFFWLTKMDPIGALIPIIIFGILTVASYYWVFSRLFNEKIGLIASFLYAALIVPVNFDSRVVPSTPTNLWLIWYFYTVVMITRGNYKVLPLLGLLIGLIWHIHIALLPALSGVVFAFLVCRKIPALRQLGGFLVAGFIPSIPLILFELRHNFSQTLSFIENFGRSYGGGTGFDKLNLILIKVSDNISRLFFYPQGWPFNKLLFFLLLLLLGVYLVKKGYVKVKELIVFYGWIITVFLYYTFSSVVISEYYFANIEIIFFTFVAIGLYALFHLGGSWRWVVLALLGLVLIKNTYYKITFDYYEAGYNERKAVAEFITKDSKEKGFPCVAVSYITKPGENVGFRYFFFLDNLHVEQPKSGAPVYTIVLPSELVVDALAAKYGQIGIIRPEKIGTKDEIEKSCSGENSNLTDPMFGFTK